MTITPLYFLNTTDALTLIAEFGTATDEQSIVTLLRSLCQQMGFDHFRLGFISPSSIQRPDVRIFNSARYCEPCQCGRSFPKLFVAQLTRCKMGMQSPIMWPITSL